MDNLENLVAKYMGFNPPAPHIYNCAESSMRALNDYYKFNLSEQNLKMFAGFGGGMKCGSTCGYIVAFVGALSLLFAEDSPAYCGLKLSQIVREFNNRIEEKYSSTYCRDIRGKFFPNCSLLGIDIAKFFVEFVEEKQKAVK